MSERQLLDPRRMTPSANQKVVDFHGDVVREVAAAVERHPVVVVGMAQNPHVRNVRRALTDAGVDFQYLEYGSYLSGWKKRLAIKMWSGWPTFPQVFVRGVLVGGEDLTKAALADGTLRSRLGATDGNTAATPA
jgi:glutaredoxin-related protein